MRPNGKPMYMIRRPNRYLIGCDVLGADPGLDINAVNRAVRGAKPMSVRLGRKFVALGIAGLHAANAVDTLPGATARRDDLIRQLTNIDATLQMSKLDPLPESAAEILRNVFLAAIAEYNATAQESADLAAARGKFFSDIVDNAKAMAQAVADKAGAAERGVESFLTALKWIGIGTAAVLGGVVVYKVGSGIKFHRRS